MLHLLAVSTLALIDQGSAGQNVVATQISTVEGAGSPVAGWVKGAVCADVTDSTDARDMLRGKHIVASEMWWMPYAKGPGMDTKSGWAGLNIDMLTRFSEILGFTFEIRDMGYPTSEYTYTDLLREQVEYADLTMSWWIPSDERYLFANYARGHVNLGTVLVGRMIGAAERKTMDWTKSFTSFLAPFTPWLWAAVIALVLLSGVVDYLVERTRVKETNLFASLYEYCAGFLWGGFEYPLSRTSAIYQILLGFVVLVFISAYTANLAAFITVSATPKNSVTSMDDAVVARTSLCYQKGGYMPKVNRIYPRMRFIAGITDGADLAELLANGTCTGALTVQNDYDAWRTNPKYCHLNVAEAVFPARGGWVTNYKSNCVDMAISYAMEMVDSSGELEILKKQYTEAVGCADTAAVAASSRRRLESGLFEPHGPKRSEEEQAVHDRRRLVTKAGESSAAAGGASDSAVPPMDMLDFLGLFIIWGGTSIAFVAYAYFPTAKCKGCLKRMRGNAKIDDAQGRVSPEAKGGPVNVDNEAAMLRELLKQMRAMRDGMTSLGATMPVGIDTDGDGVADTYAIDTNGDGTADTIIPMAKGQATAVESSTAWSTPR